MNKNIEINISKKMVAAAIAVSFAFSFGSNFFSEYTSSVTSDNGIIVSEDTTPIGTIAMWGHTTPPEKWIELNGQSTAAYPKLAAIYGGTVPDLRGQFIRAWDNGKGIDNGRALLTTQSDDNKSHDHEVTINATNLGTKTTSSAGAHTHTFTRPRGDKSWGNGSGNTWWGTNNTTTTTSSSGAHTHTVVIGSHTHTGGKANLSGGAEARPKNIALMYIVKAG